MSWMTLCRDLMLDAGTTLSFMTRIPVPSTSSTPDNLARSHRIFPLVAAMIGAIIGAIYFILCKMDVPALAAAAIALGVSAALTGALHEDGLADTADGFGGGRDKAAKLEIMRDSRLGTYGALALFVAFVIRVAALASLPPVQAIAALAVAYAIGRSALTVLAATMPYARSDGLAANAGRPGALMVITSVGVSLVIAIVLLPLPLVAKAILIAAATAGAVAMLAMRQIGGHTGDVLGAAEHCTETLLLLLFAATLASHHG
jgi:adenosylcobinamide-GDP ribazoletransferase